MAILRLSKPWCCATNTGKRASRQLRVKVLEVSEDGDKSLFVFDQPRDVKGTALLIHAHRESADDQWLYLPALKRVKRISSSNQSGSFMGSEFAYEDLTPQAVEKFTYRYLRDEAYGDLTCTVTERFPVDKKSGYSRQVVWRDKDELRVWKVEYYDRKDAHLKTLTLGNYAQYLERYWRAGQMTMVNHLTGKSTVLTWTDFEFQTDLNDRDFTQTGLKRVALMLRPYLFLHILPISARSGFWLWSLLLAHMPKLGLTAIFPGV